MAILKNATIQRSGYSATALAHNLTSTATLICENKTSEDYRRRRGNGLVMGCAGLVSINWY